MKWLKKLFSKENRSLYHVQYEQGEWEQLLKELEETKQKKERLEAYKKGLSEKEEGLKQYHLFDEADKNQLALYMGQYKAIEEKKQLLRGRLVKNNRGLLKLAEHDDELPEMVKEVNEADRKVKENERDLFYLDEEKEELIEERESLLKGYQFLKVSGGVFLFIMIFFIFIGFAMLQILREQIWVYLSVVAILMVVLLIGLLFAKDRLEEGLLTNEKLQQRAVKYTNKVKIRYYHNYSYLSFQLEKLGVESAAQLELYYNRYIKNKDNEKEYSKLNRSIMQLELSVKEIFEKRGLKVEDIEMLEEWLASPKKASTLKQLEDEQKKLDKQIEAFSAYEAELWKEIFVLKEDPKCASYIEERLRALDKELQHA